MTIEAKELAASIAEDFAEVVAERKMAEGATQGERAEAFGRAYEDAILRASDPGQFLRADSENGRTTAGN